MTLTQRITAVIQQRKIMQRHYQQEQQQQQVQAQHSQPHRLHQDATSDGRVTIWSGGKRI